MSALVRSWPELEECFALTTRSHQQSCVFRALLLCAPRPLRRLSVRIDSYPRRPMHPAMPDQQSEDAVVARLEKRQGTRSLPRLQHLSVCRWYNKRDDSWDLLRGLRFPSLTRLTGMGFRVDFAALLADSAAPALRSVDAFLRHADVPAMLRAFPRLESADLHPCTVDFGNCATTQSRSS
jgi:hypothetical protein